MDNFSFASLGIAFIAGIISFLSPCIFPIIPGFLAYLAGTSIASSSQKRMEIFLNSLFFVMGFSVVFSVLAVFLNSIFSAFAYDVLAPLSKISGLIIVFFGIYLTGLIKIPFLSREYKIKVKTKFKSKYFTSFLLGSSFAIGWSPCVGPILGSIFAIAATQPEKAFLLLLSYSVGLGIPFLIVGLFVAQASTFISRYSKWLRYINILFGIILIIIGIMIFTRSLNLFMV